MKRKNPVFLALILLCGTFFLFSCKGKEATTGTLSITAMTKNGPAAAATPIPVYLSSSKANMDKKIYQFSSWLDSGGSTIFRDLPPNYYWYRVEGWDDCGAAEVFAGVDASSILWLYSPDSTKNK